MYIRNKKLFNYPVIFVYIQLPEIKNRHLWRLLKNSDVSLKITLSKRKNGTFV